jgi:hypothetical protein
MSVSKRNRRKIHVREQLFLWWVADDSDAEGFWVLHVIADADKQQRFQYDLHEIGLAATAHRATGIPLHKNFNLESLTLTNPTVTQAIGGDRHVSPTPSFVRQLIECTFMYSPLWR